jgi:hypothetical protein
LAVGGHPAARQAGDDRQNRLTRGIGVDRLFTTGHPFHARFIVVSCRRFGLRGLI